ncbi:MAG TPA: sigma-70 family RNA polymerase sigma factor [Gemmatimonadales bacterium]|nr:sigma-70 family RNA polymerase sigma factor [Gemmatimonadales bacterium]
MEPGPDPVSPALERVVARYAEQVRRIGRRHGLSDADLDELFQEVRLRLWRARGTGEMIAASPASYVYRTAMSAAVDLIRRRRARREDSLEDLTGNPVAQPAAGEDPVEEADLAAAVARAVDALAPARRPVVRMYLAGYRLEEIAGHLGWTSGKTRNLLYRGLADLRGLLLERGIGPGAETQL